MVARLSWGSSPMTFRLRERRSNLATWSARLAAVSIPVLIIAAVGNRPLEGRRIIEVRRDVGEARAISDPTVDSAQLQRDAYPDIVSRHYSIDSQRVFDDALAVVIDRGWRLLASHRPDDNDSSGRIEAVARTMIFAFSQDVVVRVQPDGDGSLVDMRSAARNGAHDLGTDAERIRAFFGDLDTSLQGASEDQGDSG